MFDRQITDMKAGGEGAAFTITAQLPSSFFFSTDGSDLQYTQFEFEEFVAKGDDSFDLQGPEDESEAIALNYTSGTTGDPKVCESLHTYHARVCACS